MFLILRFLFGHPAAKKRYRNLKEE